MEKVPEETNQHNTQIHNEVEQMSCNEEPEDTQPEIEEPNHILNEQGVFVYLPLTQQNGYKKNLSKYNIFTWINPFKSSVYPLKRYTENQWEIHKSDDFFFKSGFGFYYNFFTHILYQPFG